MTRRSVLVSAFSFGTAIALSACGATGSAPGAPSTALVTTAVSSTAPTSKMAATGPATQAAAPKAPAGNGVTLQFWIWGGKPQADLLTGKNYPGLDQQHPDVKEIKVQVLASV